MSDRKTIRHNLRDQLVTLIPQAVEVYASQPHDFAHNSPVIFLSAAGSEYPSLSFRGYDSTFYIVVNLCVWYGNKEEGTWDEEAASDLLDDLEAGLAAAVLTLRNDPTQLTALGASDLSQFGPSDNSEMLLLGGELYLREKVVLQVKP